MMSKLPLSLKEKEKKEFSLLSLGNKLESFTFYLLILFLPTQLCKHFWPSFSQVLGIRIDYLSPAIYLTDLALLILFIFSIKRIVKSFSRFSPLFLILPYLLLTILLSGQLFPGLYQLLKIIELLFLGFYVAERVKTKNELSLIILIASISVIGESLLAIAQYIHQGSLNGLFYFLGERTFTSDTPGIANASINGQLILRPYATFPHPNALAGYLLCMITIIFLVKYNSKDNKQVIARSRYHSDNTSLRGADTIATKQSLLIKGLPRSFKSLTLQKIIKTLALLLGQIALLLTLSRTAILLWIILLFSVLVLKIKNSPKKKLSVIFTALLIAILAFASFVYTPALDRLEETTTTEQAFTQRIYLLKNALTLISAHPFFGVGLGNYLPSVAAIQKPLPSTLYIQPVHNIFLLLTSEIGIIGLLFFLALLFKTYQRLYGLPHYIRNPLLIALSVILILGLFDHYWITLQQNQLLFAVILGLCWVL
jgi:O-antigen ligase